MKIKKYVVKALSEVDALILRDLGPQAVILTVRKIKPEGFASLFFADQLEVVAAVEEEQTETPGLKKAREWESPIQTMEEINSALAEKTLPGLKEPQKYEASKIPGTYLDPRFNRKQAVETANETILSSTTETPVFVREEEVPPLSQNEENKISSQNFENARDNLKRVSKSLISRFAFISEETYQPLTAMATSLNLENTPNAYQSYLPWLFSRGLEPLFAETIAKSCQAQYGSDMLIKGTDDEEFVERMAKEIAQRIPIYGPLMLPKNAPACLAIVGPSGIGKTTALLKIAHQYAHEGNKSTAFIDIDSEGIGQNSVEVEMPFCRVRNPQELEQAFLEFKNRDLILVDLPQFTTSVQDSIQEWVDILKRMEKLQVHLALPAGIKIRDAQKWTGLLQIYSPKALIVTKTDETSTLGSIPTLCDVTGLSLSYLTNGPKISSLQIADPNAIAKAIIYS